MFEKLFKIAKRADYDMVECAFYDEASDKNAKTIHKDSLGELNLEKRKSIVINSGYIWNRIIKKDIIIKNNIKFREKIDYEDLEFIPLLSLYCEKICATNMVLYNYRLNDSSITRKYNTKVHICEKMDSTRSLVKKFKEVNAYDDYKDEITYRVYKVYVNMIQTIVALEETKNVNAKLFKDLRDFFFQLVDYNYINNKYIMQMNEKDKLLAEVNDNDYIQMFYRYSELLN